MWIPFYCSLSMGSPVYKLIDSREAWENLKSCFSKIDAHLFTLKKAQLCGLVPSTNYPLFMVGGGNCRATTLQGWLRANRPNSKL